MFNIRPCVWVSFVSVVGGAAYSVTRHEQGVFALAMEFFSPFLLAWALCIGLHAHFGGILSVIVVVSWNIGQVRRGGYISNDCLSAGLFIFFTARVTSYAYVSHVCGRKNVA
jgi:hypothetical protein